MKYFVTYPSTYSPQNKKIREMQAHLKLDANIVLSSGKARLNFIEYVKNVASALDKNIPGQILSLSVKALLATCIHRRYESLLRVATLVSQCSISTRSVVK